LKIKIIIKIEIKRNENKEESMNYSVSNDTILSLEKSLNINKKMIMTLIYYRFKIKGPLSEFISEF
jgi:tetrahydromethanopterin S-methyltransferase subunit A